MIVRAVGCWRYLLNLRGWEEEGCTEPGCHLFEGAVAVADERDASAPRSIEWSSLVEAVVLTRY